MKRSWFLSIPIIIFGLTLLLGPAALAKQDVLTFYPVLGFFYDDVLNMFLGSLLMIGAIGVVTGLWLRFGREHPMRLSGKQWAISTLALVVVGYIASWLVAGAYNHEVIQLDSISWYAANLIWYGTGMMATLATAWALKRHVIEGDNSMAAWARERTPMVPATRASRPLPSSRVAVAHST